MYKKIAFGFCLVFFIIGCNETSIPLPYGYFRVSLPSPSYRTIDTLNLPYSFDIPTHVKLVLHPSPGDKYWIDIVYPTLHASVYCSYKPVQGNLMELVEDSRKIVYKHSVRADGIGEKTFDNPQTKVHGILYDLEGNTASSLQFLLTDSTHHFFRGALYFENVPNKDSIAPMAEYIREDVVRIIESFRWKN